MNTGKSLYRFLSVNRRTDLVYQLKIRMMSALNQITSNNNNNQPETPVTPVFSMSDFGENVINNHQPSDAWHSDMCQTIFNYVTRNYRNRCTCYQSDRTNLLGNKMFGKNDVLEKASLVKADMVFTPYTSSAQSYAQEYNNFVLTVGSHFDNNTSDGIPDNDDRHNITIDANTFLEDSIAVSARRETLDGIEGSTSYGFGMEFFEDTSPEGLDVDYPAKELLCVIAEVRTSADGYYVYANRTMDMLTPTYSKLNVGDILELHNGGLVEQRIIENIGTNGTIKVTQPYTPFVVDVKLELYKNGVKIAEVGTESNGTKLRTYNIATTDLTQVLTVGDAVTIKYPDNHEETTIVTKINRYDFININAISSYSIPGIYSFYYNTLGNFVTAQAESWANPIIAGKLKIIKLETGANWDTVRLAARATAKRKILGDMKYDSGNWDMWRGFGKIDVQAAINYINN